METQTPQHRQPRRTRKGDATPTPLAPQKKPRPEVSKARRLRHLLAVLEFLSATEPYFQRELANCADAVRLKAARTAEGDLRTVLETLTEGGATIAEIETETGIPYDSVYAVLRTLQQAGLVFSTRLRTKGERRGRRGGPSKILMWWLKAQW